MKKFNVHKHPTFVNEYEAVKQGFSWPAFFVGFLFAAWIWMLVKKLWGWAGWWIALSLLISMFFSMMPRAATDSGFPEMIQLAVYLAYWLIPAFKGNSWRERDLQERGYTLVCTVEAPDEITAIGHASLLPNARKADEL